MHGLETIKRMNAEAAERAESEGIRPARISSHDDIATLRCPHLGDAADALDDRHERIDTLFVDSSGFGGPAERALTQYQFLARLGEMLDEHGPIMVAGVSAGQFQIHVGVWSQKAKGTSNE